MYVDGELRCESLSDDDARRATRYAVNEMNGFPNWFAGLAEAKPVPVGEVLTECVHGEWKYPVEREFAMDVLADLAWEGRPLARLMRPAVLENLGKGDPGNPAILDAAMSLVLKTVAIPDESLTRIAAERCSVAPIDSANFALWCAVWLQLDASLAISRLDERLRECATPDAVILSICSLLEGGVRQRLPLPRPPELPDAVGAAAFDPSGPQARAAGRGYRPPGAVYTRTRGMRPRGSVTACSCVWHKARTRARRHGCRSLSAKTIWRASVTGSCICWMSDT
jgi:hypothetical protein